MELAVLWMVLSCLVEVILYVIAIKTGLGLRLYSIRVWIVIIGFILFIVFIAIGAISLAFGSKENSDEENVDEENVDEEK